MSLDEVKVAEYFAGIGLARLGLEAAGFTVSWSNDISAKKKKLFAARFGNSESTHRFQLGDLNDVRASDIPLGIDVAWASFPCTDLSVAGAGGGIHVGGSSAFWAFAKNLAHLGRRRPKVVAIENVSGLVTNREGKDLKTVVRVLNKLGYSVDLLVLDAKRFVPQSRPRLFILGELGAGPERTSHAEVSELRPAGLDRFFDDEELIMHRRTLPAPPIARVDGLLQLARGIGLHDASWWDADRTGRFLASLSTLQAERLAALQATGVEHYRAAYRRMRQGVPRWEMRADGIAGCLRTARGGSSRQAVVRIDGDRVQIRWMTGMEYGALMGAPLSNLSGFSESELQWGFGDAVCVPVVEWLARNYITPALRWKVGAVAPSNLLYSSLPSQSLPELETVGLTP